MSEKGKILKGIAGFYYVHTGSCVYECKAKGIFRKENIKPLAGDDVLIDITDEAERKGNISEILERRNSLIRPAVANIDQAAVIFSVHKPEPVWGLLDRYLLVMEYFGIHTFICINKDDLRNEDDIGMISRIYTGSGADIIFVSTVNGTGIDQLKNLIHGKTTAVAGPSGVGKSSIVNTLLGKGYMETGELSHKVDRGRQTTRHTELVPLEKDTFILDSPGFSAIDLPDMGKEELKSYFPEFWNYTGKCRYNGCVHVNEPDCAVKDAVDEHLISRERYDSYLSIYEELKNKRSY